MRVLHLIPSLAGGGAERTLLRLVHDAATATHSIALFRERGEYLGAARDAGIDMHVLGGNSKGRLAKALGFRRLVSAVEPDIIHSWVYQAHIIGATTARRAGLPSVAALRVDADRRAFDFETWAAARVACGPLQGLPTRWVACSRSVAESHRRFGLTRRIDVIENGIETRSARPVEQDEARRRLGFSDDEVVVGRPGRWHPQKDYRLMLQAFARSRSSVDGLALVLAGSDVEPSNNELVSMARDLGVIDHTRMLGFQSDMRAFYAACDVICSTSIAEGFPNVILEAMATGTPVIATDAGATREIVGSYGWVVPVGDADAFTEALVRATTMSRESLRALGVASARHVGRQFGVRRMIAAYETLYDSLVAG